MVLFSTFSLNLWFLESGVDFIFPNRDLYCMDHSRIIYYIISKFMPIILLCFGYAIRSTLIVQKHLVCGNYLGKEKIHSDGLGVREFVRWTEYDFGVRLSFRDDMIAKFKLNCEKTASIFLIYF